MVAQLSLFGSQRHDRVLSVHDLPAATSLDPGVGPDELAAPAACLGPGFTPLRHCGVAEEAHADIVRLVGQERPGASRRTLNCCFLVEEFAVKDPDKVLGKDALYNGCIVCCHRFGPGLLTGDDVTLD